MNKSIQILDGIFEKNNNDMEFKRNLYRNNPPQELMQHTKKNEIPWGSKLSMYMLDYYLKTGKIKEKSFYKEAGYSKNYFPEHKEEEISVNGDEGA